MTTVVTVGVLVLLMLALVSNRATTPTPVVMMTPVPPRSGDSAFVFLMGVIVLVILALRGLG